jgi:large subunit ribosomal protein L13
MCISMPTLSVRRTAQRLPVLRTFPPGGITPGGTKDLRTHTRRLMTVRTFSPKAGDIQRQWHVIDANDVVLGRLASQAAILLRGKHKPIFAPHVDTGDFVIVINADKIALSGNKLQNKMAYRHSGYPGGLRSIAYGDLLAKHPTRAVEKAIKGMLPKNTLGRQMLSKLKVYAGPDHPHKAQQPVPFEITQVAQPAGTGRAAAQ